MLVVIKEMNTDMRFPQKIIHSAVGIEAAKGKQVVHRFYRYVFSRALITLFVYRCKLQGIVFPAQAAGIKKIVRLFQELLFYSEQ